MRDEKYSPLTIMVVEDDELGLKYVKTLLQGIGVGLVMGVENGAEAMLVLSETEHDIDLVICDVEMPQMNGFEFARRVRYGTVPRFKDLPILMITGRTTEKHVQYARTHKVSRLIEKPLTADVLRVEIDHVLGI